MYVSHKMSKSIASSTSLDVNIATVKRPASPRFTIPSDSKRLSASRTGVRLTPSSAANLFSEICELVGIRKDVIAAINHSYASSPSDSDVVGSNLAMLFFAAITSLP